MAATRREARERVLELLYEAEIKDVDAVELLDTLAVAPDEWTTRYATGVQGERAVLDRRIEAHLRGDWNLDRLALIERLVLRMGIWELAHGDAPPAVVLSEAVELAKRYGGDQSAQFVNGLLAAVATSSS